MTRGPLFIQRERGDGLLWSSLCQTHAIAVRDPIAGELRNLAEVHNPAAGGDDVGQIVKRAMEDPRGSEAVGLWVYFPWMRTMVHVLDRDDYFDVITSRNRDKLTREELLALRDRTIAVLGFSVGGEAAVTVAQEHLCGTIVLADFDALDLSNLTRLGTGVDELDVSKWRIVARRIARIDPYMTVRVFPDAVTAENAADFLEGTDLLLDLEPFHGRVTGPQPSRRECASAADFMRALAEWIGGWDNLSERSRNSLLRIGSDLGGYPQLASEARLAAGQLGHVARRLLLGEALAPYFGYVDLDAILPVDT